MQDPNIERYAADLMAGQIFATDAVLAHLMTCSRSVRTCTQPGRQEGGGRRLGWTEADDY